MIVFIVMTILLGDGLAVGPPIAETSIGIIIGHLKEVSVFGETKYVENFLGIPYAEPPVGELRFQNAVPKLNLTAPLNATKHGKPCYQMNIFNWAELERSEDCLFLNVYVPANNQGGLPVMIFFHGGALVHGASDYYVSDTLASFGNVIVVTFNYRLSIFGFLSTGDKFAPGNYAFSDQHLAIKWVNENIQSFGGDPEKITLFGQSAGGNSISFQSVYKGNSDLFKRAILQSGAGIPRPWEVSFAEPKKDAQKLGNIVGCPSTTSSKRLIECLMDVPAEELYNVLNNASNGFFAKFPLPFIVNTVDGEFIKTQSRDFLGFDQAGRDFFASRDFMIGITSNEGCFFVSPTAGVMDPENFNPDRTMYRETLIPIALRYAFNTDPPKLVKDLMVQVYTYWNDSTDSLLTRNNFVNLYTDIIFAETSLEVTKEHTKLAIGNATTYLYEFDVLTSAKVLPSPSWCNRGTHGDELHFQFFEETGGLIKYIGGFENYEPEDWEQDYAKIIMTTWTNFAKTGYFYIFITFFYNYNWTATQQNLLSGFQLSEI